MLNKIYNLISSIKTAIYNTLIIALLLGPARGIFAFLACQLGLPWLVFILAILLIVISLLLRAGLENKFPAISLRAICIPLFIILFLWLMHSFNFIEKDSALYASCLTALPDWEEISTKMEDFFTSSVDKGQMAIAGGADSKGIEGEKGLKKLIPSSMAMDGQNNRNLLHGTESGENNSFRIPVSQRVILEQESQTIETKISTLQGELASINVKIKAAGVTPIEVELLKERKKELSPQLTSLKYLFSDLEREKRWLDNSKRFSENKFQYGFSLLKIMRESSLAFTDNCNLRLYHLNFSRQEYEIIHNVVEKSRAITYGNPLKLSPTDKTDEIRITRKFLQVIRHEFDNIP